MNWDLNNLLRESLMCSIFINPVEPGLEYEELQEVGRRAGYRDGEINDVLQHVPMAHYSGNYYVPPESAFISGVAYLPEEPELHDFDALDFVVSALNERIKEDGVRSARLDRSVVVERAMGAGLQSTPVEAAITFLMFHGTIAEESGTLRVTREAGPLPLPGNQRRQWGRPSAISERPARARALPIVRDIISRRTDGRSRHVAPLNAFPDALSRLGYGQFRLWWMQIASELRGSDPNSAPVSALVLAAALVESVLAFVVKHARENNLAVFQSTDFRGDPRSWKLEDLTKSAAVGGDAAILSLHAKARVETLIKARQRIHAGRMLSEQPGGPPDLKPEQARDAKDTAELVTRSVLDWLEKFPPTSSHDIRS